MLTIDEFILQKKKKDKLNEFNFEKHTENMSTVIQYVMEYFNEYLDPVSFDFERNKIDQAIRKFQDEIIAKYPLSAKFIIEYFKKTKQRIDRLLYRYIEKINDYELLYTEDDFRNAALFLNKDLEKYDPEIDMESLLKIFIAEYKKDATSAPEIGDMKNLDNNIVDWVKETYREYGVNLINYAQSIIEVYHERYIDHVYDETNATSYNINRYDYRYQENPFDINNIYERNAHRPFFQNHKGEFEMILMHIWLFEEIMDTDYWAEYVNLCVSTGRVNIVRNINVLVPVSVAKVNYPPEIKSAISYLETIDGSFLKESAIPYILRINHRDSRTMIWSEIKEVQNTIENLKHAFAQYGPPKVLEIMSPYKDSQYTEKEFFEIYTIFEKAMQKYKNMKIAIVNGPLQYNKQREYMVTKIEDIAKFRYVSKSMRFKLKLSLDFSSSNRRNALLDDQSNSFSYLSSIRSDVICIHLNSIDAYNSRTYISDRDDKDHSYYYLNKYKTNINSDFLSGLSMFLRDSKPRYLIPEKLKSPVQLESLVDILLRGGFSFSISEASYD